jgi:hypothetical protein
VFDDKRRVVGRTSPAITERSAVVLDDNGA